MGRTMRPGQLSVRELREIKQQLPARLEAHEKTLRRSEGVFFQLEQLEQIRAKRKTPKYQQEELRRLEKAEPALLKKAERARAKIRASKHALAELLDPVWTHIAANPEPKWAAIAAAKPKRLREEHAEELIELAIFAVSEQQAHMAVTLAKELIRNHYLRVEIKLSQLRALQQSCNQRSVDPVLQLKRLGLYRALQQMEAWKQVERIRKRLKDSGLQVGTVHAHQIRLMAPADLQMLGQWLDNCVGSHEYAARARAGMGAILAAYPLEGEYQGLPVALVELTPRWHGFKTQEWGGRYLSSYSNKNPGQQALKQFMARKSAAQTVRRAASKLQTV